MPGDDQGAGGKNGAYSNIADVTPTYGMILSRHQGSSVGCSIQFELSYATIQIFEGYSHCLYK